LTLNSHAQIQRFLDRMLPGLEQGERFILSDVSRYFTVTNETFIDIQNWLASGGELAGETDYGDEDPEFYSNMTVSSMPNGVGAAFKFAQGAYFPYIHNLLDDLEGAVCLPDFLR